MSFDPIPPPPSPYNGTVVSTLINSYVHVESEPEYRVCTYCQVPNLVETPPAKTLSCGACGGPLPVETSPSNSKKFIEGTTNVAKVLVHAVVDTASPAISALFNFPLTFRDFNNEDGG